MADDSEKDEREKARSNGSGKDNERSNDEGGQDKGAGKEKEEKTEEKPPDPAKRRRGFIIAAIVLVVVAFGAFGWWSYSQTYETTDDAEIDGHLNPIASRVTGTIKAVYVEDNQHVEAGKPLVDLDPSDNKVTLAQAQAQYDEAVAQIKAEQPNVPITQTSNATDLETARAEVINAEAALAGAQKDAQSNLDKLRQAEANNGKAQLDVARYRQLLDKHEVAQSDYDQYDATAKAQAAGVGSQKATLDAAAKTVEQRQAQLKEQRAKLQQTINNAPRQISIKNASVLQKKASAESAAAQLKQSQLNLSYCHILAPVSGIVTERSAEVGAPISIGQQLMLVVQTSDLWVTANFKETQLRKVRRGQRATVKVDGLDKTFEGYVESLPASTGDRTSALPPENATGNYVKIVQRMPLRIRFKENQAGLDQLRPGMSVEPKIHF